MVRRCGPAIPNPSGRAQQSLGTALWISWKLRCRMAESRNWRTARPYPAPTTGAARLTMRYFRIPPGSPHLNDSVSWFHPVLAGALVNLAAPGSVALKERQCAAVAATLTLAEQF